MFCPTFDQVTEQVLYLLPRGRAWQTNEGLPQRGWSAAFNAEYFNDAYFLTTSKKRSILYDYWRAFSKVAHYVNERACALRKEFWCATLVETRDLWMTEYGLPDACDPFPDLCAKVAAIGGTRCEYYQEIAARAGWVIDCEIENNDCGTRMGCGYMGNIELGGQTGGWTIVINVYIDESTAYTGSKTTLPYVGNFLIGRSLACEPDISPLICVLDRIVHAHVFIRYKVISGEG